MTFSDKQVRALKAKLAHRHVKTRQSNGMTLAYVEGWHVIAEANRIFGFEHWDRRTLEPRCLWRETERGNIVCFYATRVRIKVRAGDTLIVREGIGTGVGRAAQADVAHEIALKAAETDATKRALATFGNPFGLALYDKSQHGVSKPKRPQGAPCASTSGSVMAGVLSLKVGREDQFATQEGLLAALDRHLEGIKTLKDLYAFWEDNKSNLSSLDQDPQHRDLAQSIILRLKDKARAFKVDQTPLEAVPQASPAPGSRFLIPKERRVRDKTHLDYVRSKPCVICGRTPVHAHHLRFAQRRAMGLKVSDEFTVPLCSIHHDEIHRTGDERAWWARHGIIEPLKLAEKFWAQSRGQNDPDEHAPTKSAVAMEARPQDRVS